MNSPYGNTTIGIKNYLKTLITKTVSFKNSTYVDSIGEVDTTGPIAVITLESDAFKAEGPHTTLHTLEFNIEIGSLAEFSENTLDTLLGYVGEIVDGIEADRGHSSVEIENIEVGTIDYTWEQDEYLVMRKALIPVTVIAYRNS